jgi:hypothetical protein
VGGGVMDRDDVGLSKAMVLLVGGWFGFLFFEFDRSNQCIKKAGVNRLF